MRFAECLPADHLQVSGVTKQKVYKFTAVAIHYGVYNVMYKHSE